MAKPNYAFQKRQRELAKKQKKEEKRQRRAEPSPESEVPAGGHEADASAPTQAPGDFPGFAPER